MITLVRLQRQLLRGLEALLLKLLHLTRKHRLRRGRGINAVRLDGDDELASGLQEELCVVAEDTGLVGLRDISEHHVNHADQHAVLHGVTGILDNGDHICALLGHVHQVTSGALRELNCVHETGGSDQIGAMGDGGARRGTEVKQVGSGLDVDVVHTTEDSGGQLGAERIPHAVLGLGTVRVLVGDTLLAVHAFSGNKVLCHKGVLLAAGNEHAFVPMLLDHHLSASLHSSATAAASPTATTITSAASTPATAITATASTTATTIASPTTSGRATAAASTTATTIASPTTSGRATAATTAAVASAATATTTAITSSTPTSHWCTHVC
mmetsp:Transcript_26151/g.43769  ORF Transcript_26151/g.43769 Transcript_26151/m.43769 type:complete len:327 (-) Transcript_26151:93-1073(-)